MIGSGALTSASGGDIALSVGAGDLVGGSISLDAGELASLAPLSLFYQPKGSIVHPGENEYHTVMMEDSYSYFYLLSKLHKSPIKCLLNAVVSFSVGQLVDAQLQPIAQSFPSYLMDSFVLKKQLPERVLPPVLLCSPWMPLQCISTKIDSTACLEVLS